MSDTSERPSIDETYATARNTSDLTVTAERRTAADVIIAAGSSHSDLSAALSSLQAQWDTTPKCPKMTDDAIKALAESYPKKGKPDYPRARVEAMVWHARQHREQAKMLPGRARVLEILAPWVAAKGIDPALTWLAVYHWLHSSCPACDGLGKRRAPDAPVLMAQCLHCQGSGQWPEPQGAARIKSHLEDAMHNASKGMKKRLHGGRN